MPDTLTPHRMGSATLRCVTDNVPWPCDYAKLLAHIDALAAAVGALTTLRAAAVKAGAHIVVTNDYPDGVKAFGVLCDAIDKADAVLAILRGES